MKKINVYSVNSAAVTSMVLPKEFSEPENKDLLDQAIHVYRDRQHIGSTKRLTRGEVKRTKAKWYRQKGTGRARHGARSAHIFVGGGLAHGPKGESRTLTLPKKMRRKALNIALSIKAREKNIFGVTKLDNTKKTKDAINLLDKIIKKEKIENKNPKFTLIVSKENAKIAPVFRNISGVKILPFQNINAYNIHFGGRIILDEDIYKKETKTKKKS